jgi:hypothetical protein
VPGFGPWHRAYLRQFELALQDAARTAAGAFSDRKLRRQFEGVAETIRLPYWDWTNPAVPELLTARSVTVLDVETGEPTQIRNPFGMYEYTVSTVFCSFSVLGMKRCCHTSFLQVRVQHTHPASCCRCSAVMHRAEQALCKLVLTLTTRLCPCRCCCQYPSAPACRLLLVTAALLAAG